MGRRVIEILADSANNWNASPMETERDEVTAVGITIDGPGRALPLREGRVLIIADRPSRAALILDIAGDAARSRPDWCAHVRPGATIFANRGIYEPMPLHRRAQRRLAQECGRITRCTDRQLLMTKAIAAIFACLKAYTMQTTRAAKSRELSIVSPSQI
jgi:hypothetical protein